MPIMTPEISGTFEVYFKDEKFFEELLRRARDRELFFPPPRPLWFWAMPEDDKFYW